MIGPYGLQSAVELVATPKRHSLIFIKVIITTSHRIDAYCVQSSFDGQQVVRHEAGANRKESPASASALLFAGGQEWAAAQERQVVEAVGDDADDTTGHPLAAGRSLPQMARPLGHRLREDVLISRLYSSEGSPFDPAYDPTRSAARRFHARRAQPALITNHDASDQPAGRGKRRRKKQMGGLLPVDSTEGAAVGDPVTNGKGWKAEAKVEQAHGPLPDERRRCPDRDFVINNTRRPGIRKAIGAWTVLGFEFMIRQKGSN
ncbi:hypothetical protein EDB83DRAFT_2312677 [Lactarius deliciosus]|nr:hypothetical protein EDB83DRAFT_2312677 [Lactarius deliciosus]